MKLSSPVTPLRIFSLLDACSWLYLIYCSVYLKRILGDDTAIRIPGIIHAVFFSAFGVALLYAMIRKKWSIWLAIGIGITSVIPFAPFWLETWLKKQED